jgi:hypothetical protein
LGETKRRDETSPCQEKRCAYGCWSEKAIRANEGPLGSKKKVRRNKGSTFSEERWTHTCRPKKAFAVDEGSLGGAKENGAQVVDQDNRKRRLPITFAFK